MCSSRALDESVRVLFDTNVIERRYLKSMLLGQPCRDFALVRRHGLRPAVHFKTVRELWAHAKFGNSKGAKKAPPWASPECDYPGSLDWAAANIVRHADAKIDEQRTAAYWFNLCEEWADTVGDPDDFPRWESLLGAPYARAQRDFLGWKRAMRRFLERIEGAIESQAELITYHELFGSFVEVEHARHDEREVAMECLLPAEDFEFFAHARALGVVAFVTEDRRLLERGRLSMGLNLGAPALVHPDWLWDALRDELNTGQYVGEGATPRSEWGTADAAHGPRDSRPASPSPQAPTRPGSTPEQATVVDGPPGAGQLGPAKSLNHT